MITAMFTKLNAQCSDYITGNQTFYNSSGIVTVTPYSYISGVYYVNSNLEINSDVNFTDAALVMAANVKINTTSSGNLTLKGCCLFACDSTIWKGIVIEYNSSVTPSKNGTPRYCIYIQRQFLISKIVAAASNTLEIGKLAAGIYLVRVTTVNNKVVSSKIGY